MTRPLWHLCDGVYAGPGVPACDAAGPALATWHVDDGGHFCDACAARAGVNDEDAERDPPPAWLAEAYEARSR